MASPPRNWNTPYSDGRLGRQLERLKVEETGDTLILPDQTISSTGTSSSVVSVWSSTKYADGETGLLYFGFRYYQPGTGSWLSRDPIGEKGGVNLRAFCENQPTILNDRLGLKACCWCAPQLEKKMIKTGVKRCHAPANFNSFFPHTWLEYGSRSIDLVASGNYLYSQGLVSIPSSYAAAGNKICDEIELPNCRYDADKFVSEISQKLDSFQTLVDSLTHTYVWKTWTYIPYVSDCSVFVDVLINVAKEKAQRYCPSLPPSMQWLQ